MLGRPHRRALQPRRRALQPRRRALQSFNCETSAHQGMTPKLVGDWHKPTFKEKRTAKNPPMQPSYSQRHVPEKMLKAAPCSQKCTAQEMSSPKTRGKPQTIRPLPVKMVCRTTVSEATNQHECTKPPCSPEWGGAHSAYPLMTRLVPSPIGGVGTAVLPDTAGTTRAPAAPTPAPAARVALTPTRPCAVSVRVVAGPVGLFAG
jgi:hypothetical protein